MTRRSMSTHAKLYRVLLRQCRAYEHSSLIWLQPPIDPHTAGSARLWTTHTKNTNSIHAVYQWFALNPEWKPWYQEMMRNVSLKDTNEDDSSSSDDDDEEEELDRSLWTTSSTLQQALRTAFRQSPPQYAPLALQAFRQLRHQWHQQEYCTSTNTEHNIRISVLSQYIGRSLEHKYRFAYRVRIERLIAEEEEEEEEEDNDDTVLSADDMAVQLLGRTWHIVESSSNDQDDERTIVDAPTTGAVGQLPVLQRGSCFEYTSGAELSGRQGSMSGWFHFAPVPVTTSSAVVGMAVPALSSERKFRVEIKPFPLRVHEDDDALR